MAIRNIDFGSFPDDPNADAIRTAFEKIQENFVELFANRDQEVYSVNRTAGAGITVNSPTGNVVVSANIAQVRIQSSTLDLSTGSNATPGSLAVVTSGTVPIFINLPQNLTGINSIVLSGALNAQDVNVSALLSGNTASFTGNITAGNTVFSNNIVTGNITVNTFANISGTLNVTGNVNASVVNASSISSGNISATNIGVISNITANNVTANFLFGDGTGISNVAAAANTRILNGSSYANISDPNGNLNIVITGNPTMTVTATGANITGTANITGDLTAGNITAATLNGRLANGGTSNVTIVSSTGNVTTAVAGTTRITATASGANITGNLGVSGVTSLGPVGNVKISGGNVKQVIQTDGTGNLSFTTVGAAQNVLYVSKSGNDSNDGNTLDSAKLTLAAACAIATSGTTIFVKSGDYTEVNPISVPAGVSIVGDDLRSVSIRPANPTQDILHVRNGCYVTGMTFRDHLDPSAAVAFPTGGAGNIFTSPYIQNCSSITTTGCGMRIDGSLAGGLKSMVTDSYTQFNQDGKGIHILNQGYAQLVSIFTICCSIGIHCESGGQCSVANSNNAFGDFGLVADGQSPILYSGTVTSFINGVVEVGNLTQRPAVNDSFQFAGDTTWYTVKSATPLDNGTSVVIYDQPAGDTPAPGTPVDFYQPSFISASSQTFEYVGTGTNLLTATPRLGGIPIQGNEVTELNGGIINFTSTDQFGDFRIGEGLVINSEAGTISGPTFEKGLFAVLTPYILALEG
jgi:hypothetical protein